MWRDETFSASFLQVVIPLGLQRRIEGLLQEHLDRGELSSGKVMNNSGNDESIDQAEGTNLDENPDSFLDRSVMEKVLQRKSLRMRNMQRAWQVLLSFPCGIKCTFYVQHILKLSCNVLFCLRYQFFFSLVLQTNM